MSERIPTSESSQPPTNPRINPRINPMWQRQRRPFRFILIVYSIMLPLFVVLLVVAFVTRQDGNTFFLLITDLVLFSLLFALFLFLYRFQGGFWRRAEQRRALAVQGDPQFLATDQPIPNANALSLPTTIQLGVKRRFFELMLLVMALGVVGGLILGVFIVSHLAMSGHDRPLKAGEVALVFGVPIVIFLAVMLFSLWLAARRARQSLTVTEHGLTGRLLGKVSTVEWADANAFAMIGVKKMRRATIYELSGPHGSVHWTRPTQRPLWFMDLLGPNGDPADYQRQMDGVLAVIAAKTGLPLYDLRETSQRWYY